MLPILTRQWTFPTDQALKGSEGNASFRGTKTIRDTLADHIEKVGTQLTNYHGIDILANRPPAGMLGRNFYATDTQTFYEDIGTEWVPIGGSAPFSPITVIASGSVTTANNLYLVTTGTGTVTLTLPAATGSNFAPIFKHLDTQGNLIIQPDRKSVV